MGYPLMVMTLDEARALYRYLEHMYINQAHDPLVYALLKRLQDAVGDDA